ncbi:MAG: hypothetical protein KC503_32345 [Myxococcales bacterium]|nr:hypothetical protein [Myxococcales bacterium]
MRQTCLVLAALTAFGCSDDPAPSTPDCALPARVTYADHIGPFLGATCTTCHASTLAGAARQGAPGGVDFDDEARFAPFAALSLQRFAEATHPSPPAPERCQLALLRAYVRDLSPPSSDASVDGPRGDGPPTPPSDSRVDTLSPDLCASGTTLCGGSCVDTHTSGAHCGGCNKPCTSGTVCRDGACAADCGSLTQCGQSCVDTQGNDQHCGGCNKACSAAQRCNGGSCTCAISGVSFKRDVQPIFSSQCATVGCHVGIVPKESLDLSTARAYQELVGVTSKQCADGRKLVSTTGASSYLLDKLLGINLCRGTQMPKIGVSLAKQQVDTIAAWICAGAPNN